MNAIIFDFIVFTILFVTLRGGMPNLFNIALYIACFVWKTNVYYGVFSIPTVIIYAIIGCIVVFILDKLVNSFNLFEFAVMAIIMQEILQVCIIKLVQNLSLVI